MKSPASIEQHTGRNFVLSHIEDIIIALVSHDNHLVKLRDVSDCVPAPRFNCNSAQCVLARMKTKSVGAAITVERKILKTDVMISKRKHVVFLWSEQARPASKGRITCRTLKSRMKPVLCWV